jgi:hypothetical protein
MSKRGWILSQGLVNSSMELFKTASSDQGFELEDGGQRNLGLSADTTGNCTCDGQRLSELHDWSAPISSGRPRQTALPIRRLAMAQGETRAVAAAWIRFPSPEIERSISPIGGLTSDATARRRSRLAGN